MKPRLLVTAAGAGSAHAVIRSARHHLGSDVWIVAADINPRHLVAAAALADVFVRVPTSDDPGFERTILDIIDDQRVDLYVPLLDHEVASAATWRETGELGRTRTTAPTPSAAGTSADKLAAARWLTDHGFPTPSTRLASEVSWADTPLIAKPRQGIGSRGVFVIETAEQLHGLADNARVVVQEMCRPPEVTVDVFRSTRSGTEGAVCRERLQTKEGVCTKARVHHDHELEDMALRVGRQLGLTGAYCIQAMRDAAGGAWQITDVNARPGAGSPMSAAVGYDVVGAMLLEELVGRDPGALLNPVEGDVYVTRVYDEVVQRA